MRRKSLKFPGEQNKYTNVPLTLKDQTFNSRASLLLRRKHPKVIGEENKYPNYALDPKGQTSKPKTELPSQKSRL